MQKTLLLTCFEPFGGEDKNASAAAVMLVPPTVGEYKIVKKLLPVVFGEAADIALAEAKMICADAIICVGQAAGRGAVTPEMVAVNLAYAKIPDNGGKCPQDEEIIAGAPAAYFATLPVRRMARNIADAGIPASVSMSAGTYVCNDVFYRLSHRFAGSATRVCFIHVPKVSESFSEITLAKAIEKAIEAIDAD